MTMYLDAHEAIRPVVRLVNQRLRLGDVQLVVPDVLRVDEVDAHRAFLRTADAAEELRVLGVLHGLEVAKVRRRFADLIDDPAGRIGAVLIVLGLILADVRQRAAGRREHGQRHRENGAGNVASNVQDMPPTSRTWTREIFRSLRHTVSSARASRRRALPPRAAAAHRRSAARSRARIASPFLLRTVDPPLQDVEGRVVRDLSRLGKRIVWHLDDDVFVVIHLMIAGRFRWKPPGAPIPGEGRARGVRIRERHAAAHRSGREAAGVDAPGERSRGVGRARSRRPRRADVDASTNSAQR